MQSQPSIWNKKHKTRNVFAAGYSVVYCRECKADARWWPTHCPVRMLTDAEEVALRAKRLDFISGEWIAVPPKSDGR